VSVSGIGEDAAAELVYWSGVQREAVVSADGMGAAAGAGRYGQGKRSGCCGLRKMKGGPFAHERKHVISSTLRGRCRPG